LIRKLDKNFFNSISKKLKIDDSGELKEVLISDNCGPVSLPMGLGKSKKAFPFEKEDVEQESKMFNYSKEKMFVKNNFSGTFTLRIEDEKEPFGRRACGRLRLFYSGGSQPSLGPWQRIHHRSAGRGIRLRLSAAKRHV
jgi:hypothetical protein